jgi:hypothetical protein
LHPVLVDVVILVLAGYLLMKRRAEVGSERHKECRCALEPQVDKVKILVLNVPVDADTPVDLEFEPSYM